MADYWNLKLKKYKDATGNWQTAISGGYLDIVGKVDPMIIYQESDYIQDSSGNNTTQKANNGYWKVGAELTGLINPFTNPVTNLEVKETKIEVSFEDYRGWDTMLEYKNYYQYLAMSASTKIEKRYKELFGVQIELRLIFVKGESITPTSATSSTGATSSTDTTKTITEVASVTGASASVSIGATPSIVEPMIYGEFTFNVEDEFIFKGNLEFGTLEVVGKGIIKEEVEDIPQEEFLQEEDDSEGEYSEEGFQGLEERDMVFEVAEYTGVGAEESDYPTPPLNGTTKYGAGMSAKEWEENGTIVIGSIVPSDLSGPVKYNQNIILNKTMTNEYLPKIKKMKGYTNGVKLLAIIMAQKEGFAAGTKSYTTNNPGNIGNTDSGATKNIKTLEDGIKLQLDYIKKVGKGEHTAYPLNKEKNIKPYYSPATTNYEPGYKFIYTGMIEQYVKIYATGARSGNSYITMIVSWYIQNGYNWVTEKTTIAQLIEQNSKDKGIFATPLTATPLTATPVIGQGGVTLAKFPLLQFNFKA